MKFYIAIIFFYSFGLQSSEDIGTSIKCNSLGQYDLIRLILDVDALLKETRELQCAKHGHHLRHERLEDSQQPENIDMPVSNLLQRRKSQLPTLDSVKITQPLPTFDPLWVEMRSPENILYFQGSDLEGFYLFNNPDVIENLPNFDLIKALYKSVVRSLHYKTADPAGLEVCVKQDGIIKQDRIIAFTLQANGVLEGYSKSNYASEVAQSLKNHT